jgi:hypothetical protein
MTPLQCVCGETPALEASFVATCKCGRRFTWRLSEERWYVLEPLPPNVGWVPVPAVWRRA